jgi:hypothetical protein
MWEPRCLTTLWASTAWYRYILTFTLLKNVKLPLCVTNKALHRKDLWGNGGIGPRILDLGTSWRWVVSFTTRPRYLRGKRLCTHWIWSCVGPRARLDDMESTKMLPLPGLELRPLGRPSVASRYTDWAMFVTVNFMLWIVYTILHN